MWLLLPLLASSSLFASSAQAVTAQAFFFTNCNSFRDNGKCTNLAQNTCCTFRPTPDLPTAAKERSHDGSTQSVKWTSLRRCLVLNWYYPDTAHRSGPGHTGYNCGGQVRKSDSTGEHTPPSVCLSDAGPGGRDDGAQWHDALEAALTSGANINPNAGGAHCGRTQEYSGSDIGQEVQDLANSLHLSSSSRSSFSQKLFGSMSMKKRDRQAQREKKVAIQNAIGAALGRKCAGAMFATHYGWTPGTGVWVLEGSEESHARMDNVSQSTNTPMTWNMHLKLAGAKYYDHWAEHPVTAESMLDQGYTFTHDEIALAKAKRSNNEDPSTEDDFSWPEKPSEHVERSADEEAVADSFAGLPEQEYDEEDDEGLTQRDVDTSVEDSFAGLPEQDYDEEDDEEEGLSRRDVNTPMEDSFAGLPEQDYDEEDNEGLAQRDVDASVEDSFAGLPERDDDEESV